MLPHEAGEEKFVCVCWWYVQMAQSVGAVSRQDGRRVRRQPRRADDTRTLLVEVSSGTNHLLRRRSWGPWAPTWHYYVEQFKWSNAFYALIIHTTSSITIDSTKVCDKPSHKAKQCSQLRTTCLVFITFQSFCETEMPYFTKRLTMTHTKFRAEIITLAYVITVFVEALWLLMPASTKSLLFFFRPLIYYYYYFIFFKPS